MLREKQKIIAEGIAILIFAGALALVAYQSKPWEEHKSETSVLSTEMAEGTELEENTEEPGRVPNLPANPNQQMYSSSSGYTIYDPFNTRGLSTERIPHSFGQAVNGQPNKLAMQSQNYFDSINSSNSMALDMLSTEKVLYLTFDCGYEYNGNTAKIVEILNEKEVPAAFFCALSFYKKNPALVSCMIENGHILGNHSAVHVSFPSISREEMASHIYKIDKYLLDTYNYECRYFRFPFGDYSECALDLVGNIGHRISFWTIAYRDWETNNQMGPDAAFEILTSRLHPGATILLHAVSDDNVAIMADFIDYARAQGYTFVSLDDYPW